MKRLRLAFVACMAVYAAASVGIGRADPGAGVCIAGYGVTAAAPIGQFVGVNAGVNSETGVYDSQGAYEEQCCAETNRPPDCFDPFRAAR